MNSETTTVFVPRNVMRFKEIAEELSKLYAEKNKRYGDSFSISVEKYGNIAALTRISDKFNRLENLILNPNIDGKFESLIDTALDMSAYGIMLAMELEKKQECSTPKEKGK